MKYCDAAELLEEADRRGLRRAFFVTALLPEMQAVRGHISEHCSARSERDGTIFECGVFTNEGESWLVVVVETGAGTHPAQNAVTQAHTVFGPFEVQILVGVGGSRKEDAPVGAVVASDHVYMPYSGKYGAKGLSFRPRTFPVDSRLVNIARKVRRDADWQDRIKPPYRGVLPSLESYPVAFPPISHVAPIASIEAVLDDPDSELEALIASGYGDTCVVEMEGYGAVYAASQERTPSIVIRGVSDMTQGKSYQADAARQPVAACHAAAFGFEMLSHYGELYALRPPQPLATPEVILEVGKTIEVPPLETALEIVPKLDVSAAPLFAVQDRAALAVEANVVLTLNLKGDPTDEALRAAIQTALRQAAGTDALFVVRLEAGSIRAFIADLEGVVLGGFAHIRSALSEQTGWAVLGASTVADDRRAASLIDELRSASAELMAWPTALPDGEEIERQEANELSVRIEGAATSTTVVLGAPGSGKSALLAKLTLHYEAQGWPVLAIKADLLDPEMTSEADLQHRLGLSAPPAQALEAIAATRPVLLVIDQLDALAGYLDLRTARLSVLLNLVRQVGRLENVHVVLSARPFEFNHDVRLRAVAAARVNLELPAWSTVLALLEARGVKAGGWPADAQAVMRSPQALATYLKLKDRRPTEPFTSYQAMLDRLWKERVVLGPNGARRALLACQIAEHMAEEESLWLAEARFEDSAEDIASLAAAGVLTILDGSIGFAHQTVFDFALSRNFARGKGRLSNYTLERQSSIFLRPKLWAALSYLRAVDQASYLLELEAIWSAPDLRRHLRFLLIDFLGSQPAPTDREALLFESALQVPDERWRAFRAIVGSPGWFARLAKSSVAEAMAADGSSARRTIEILARAWAFDPAGVEILIRERWITYPEFDGETWMVLQQASRWSEGMLAMAEALVRRTNIAPTMIDYQVSLLGVEQPDLALALVRARLERDLDQAEAEAAEKAAKPKPDLQTHGDHLTWYLRDDPRQPLRKMIEENQSWDSLEALAQEHPAAVLATLWPWFLRVLEVFRTYSTADVVIDLESAEIDFRLEYDRSSLPEPAVLGALRVAAATLARTDRDAFIAWAEVQESGPYGPPQRLVAHAMAENAPDYADRALDFLLADGRRYFLGSLTQAFSTSRDLVARVSPYWSPEQIERFETALHTFRSTAPEGTEPTLRRHIQRRTRRMRLELLRALPTHAVSSRTATRIAQEGRVFGEGPFDGGTIEAGFIGSVIDARAMTRASDDDLVNAFEMLPDASEWDHPRQFMKGGNIQLAREFAAFAATNPERANGIISRLTPANGTRAAGYALDAMAGSVGLEVWLGIFNDVIARGFDGEEFRVSVSRAVEKFAGENTLIPDSVVSVLEAWLAASRHDTGEDELDTASDEMGVEQKGDATQDPLHRSLLWGYGGLSIVPTGDFTLLEAIIRARLVRQEHDRILDLLGEYLERSADAKTWRNLIRLFSFVRPTDFRSFEFFLERLFLRVPALVGAKDAAWFLANGHWEMEEFVEGQLDAWKRGANVTTRQAYGELVALLSLIRPDLPWTDARLEALLSEDGQADARVGAALTAAFQWHKLDYRALSTKILTRALTRGPPAVWSAAFDIFRQSNELPPDVRTAEVLTVMADRLSEAPRLEATFVVDRIAGLLPFQATLVHRMAAGLVQAWQSELGDIRTSTAIAAPALADLAITLHRLGPETRELGTALFESLIELESYAAQETLEAIDSRFRDQPTGARRRLPRRKHQPRRSPRTHRRA